MLTEVTSSFEDDEPAISKQLVTICHQKMGEGGSRAKSQEKLAGLLVKYDSPENLEGSGEEF